MECFGFETGTAKWKVQRSPLGYGGPLQDLFFITESSTYTRFLKLNAEGPSVVLFYAVNCVC